MIDSSLVEYEKNIFEKKIWINIYKILLNLNTHLVCSCYHFVHVFVVHTYSERTVILNLLSMKDKHF